MFGRYEAAVQAVLDTLTEFGPPGTIDDQVLSAIAEQGRMPLPRQWGPLGDLLADRQGFVWAKNVSAQDPAAAELSQVFGRAADVRSASTWDVFDPEGRYLGPVELPEGFVPKDVDGLEVTGTAVDEFDVQYVVTLRALIPPPGY
jgi:hypothetical protein